MSRIAAALNSDDLQHHERPCDADTVRALGLTAIHRSLGILLIEAKEACAGDSPHDAARLRDLIGAVKNVTQRQADRDKLSLNAQAVAEVLVKELILDRCPRCQGRGFLPLAYGPDQADDARGADCPTCFASGRARRDLEGRASAAGLSTYSTRLQRFYEAMESRLAEAEILAFEHYQRRFHR
jgi:hypothetical protein